MRKAAVLIRSLDGDTAARLLAQLSSEAAAALRAEMRSMGPIDPDEQADVLAEFRRVRPRAGVPAALGVELALSSPAQFNELPASRDKRFEFLEQAPMESLVPYLTREHAQTIAVVLSHLAPARAAGVLAALPKKLQGDTIERITTLVETDPESVTAMEQELAAWMEKRIGTRGRHGRGGAAISAILAAADTKSRDEILRNLTSYKPALAERIAPIGDRNSSRTIHSLQRTKPLVIRPIRQCLPDQATMPPDASLQPQAPIFAFDDLINLDDRMLAAVLQKADANVLALALAGSNDELVDRICAQMPRRVARTFRRELRRLGPTRLSDVEAAQRAVAVVAAEYLNSRRRSLITNST